MSIFSFKKTEASIVAEPRKIKKLPSVTGKKSIISSNASPRAFRYILRQKVTEKSSVLSESGRNVYVFEVSKLADKRKVAEAILELYKVMPEKVTVLKIPPKKSFVRGRVVFRKDRRKAYVYLKKGETIEV